MMCPNDHIVTVESTASSHLYRDDVRLHCSFTVACRLIFELTRLIWANSVRRLARGPAGPGLSSRHYKNLIVKFVEQEQIAQLSQRDPLQGGLVMATIERLELGDSVYGHNRSYLQTL